METVYMQLNSMFFRSQLNIELFHVTYGGGHKSDLTMTYYLFAFVILEARNHLKF